MSDGLKIGLILGAAGLGAYLIYRSSSTGSPLLAPSPGAPTPPAPNATSTSTSSGHSTLTSVAKLAAAPVVIPTELTIKAGEAVASGAAGAAKTLGSAASSAVKGFVSLF